MSEAASNLPLAESSDAVLIARIRAGDSAAYGTLYERHIGAARGLARQLADDGDTAEDAVQDTFANILDVIRRGGGPRNGFRPYLLTAIRRTVYDRHRYERRLQSTDRIEQYDPGLPFIDPALAGLERSMVVRAFQSLPERWQAMLWHTEIEGAKPADVAPLLGLSSNGVTALAYRAREGLRQAYLQMHLAASAAEEPQGSSGSSAGPTVPVVDEGCRPTLEKLGSYLRGGLAKREARSVERHLDDCDRCKASYAELVDINSALRDAVGPLILGTAATAYLASQGGVGGPGVVRWFRHLPRRQQQGLGAATAAAVVAATVLAMAFVSGDRPIGPAASPPPAIVQPERQDPRGPERSPGAPAPATRPRPQPGPAVLAAPSDGPTAGSPSCPADRKRRDDPSASASRSASPRTSRHGRAEHWKERAGATPGACGRTSRSDLPGRRLGTERSHQHPGLRPRGWADVPPWSQRDKPRHHDHGKPPGKHKHEHDHGHKHRKHGKRDRHHR